LLQIKWAISLLSELTIPALLHPNQCRTCCSKHVETRRAKPQAEGKRILEPVKGKLADTMVEMEQDIQSSISYSGGKKLMDIRKVNYVTLGGDNAGEHLLM